MSIEEDDNQLVNSGIKLRKYQVDWLTKHEAFNLSGFIREKLDEIIKQDGDNTKQ